MKRREFLRVASGAAGATAAGASATAAAQQTGTSTSTPTGTPGEGTGTGTPQGTGTPGGGNQSGGNQTGEGGGGGGGGGSLTVNLVDFAFEPGTEQPAYITPGTTVNFVWQTANHNIVVDSQPEGANWEGHEPIEGTGFEYQHTFEQTGEYTFHCQPHLSQGMEGTIVVNEQGAPPGGGAAEADPEHMGVPFQAHFVGLATIVGIVISLVFTFFFLKYGETPHSGYPEEK